MSDDQDIFRRSMDANIGHYIDQTVVLDIETASIPDVTRYLNTDLHPPKNYKKAESIESWKVDAIRKQVDTAALDPDLCRVVAIGLWPEDGKIESTLATTQDEEREMIAALWKTLYRARVVGFNIIGFDLPVLLRRSLYLGIKGAPYFNLNKYRPSTNIVDLMVELSMRGVLSYRSLKWYAKRFGLSHRTSGIEGRDIPMLVEANHWDAIRQHVEDDVQLTGELATRMDISYASWPVATAI